MDYEERIKLVWAEAIDKHAAICGVGEWYGEPCTYILIDKGGEDALRHRLQELDLKHELIAEFGQPPLLTFAVWAKSATQIEGGYNAENV